VLIDQFLPVYNVAEHHAIQIDAPAGVVYERIRTTDFATSPAVRVLFGLRALPATLLHRRPPRPRRVGIDTFLHRGAVLLGERAQEELVLGLVGQFWKPAGRNVRLGRGEFRTFDRAGYAKAVINFAVAPRGPGRAILSTETRVLCLDPRTRRKFRLYWFVIAPFSAYTRREMLQAVKRHVEPA
jgi:hypothetical protein